MWPSGQGLVPFMPQNLTFYDSQAYPEAQSQQLVPYRAQALPVYDPRSNPETRNLQGATDVTLVPYSHQEKWEKAVQLQQDVMAGGMVLREQDRLSQDRSRRESMQPEYMMGEVVPRNLQVAAYTTTLAPYSHQENWENPIRLPQNTAGDMVFWDQNWLPQALSRRESMQPEYMMGEVVMVRCNKRKWLPGVIQRMSAHGMRIWISDAHLLVNVPLELFPTHVFKMSTYSELQTLPPSKPMFSMATIDNEGCRRLPVQCVRPAHLSHRQLYHMSDCLVCVLCKTPLSLQPNVVKPWNCPHRVHDHCLQLQMQHSSTSVCPAKSCNRNNTRRLVPLPSTYASSRNSSSNGQLQQHLDVWCVCGFRASMAGVRDMNKPLFCPNCNQPANVNQITIALPSEQLSAGTDLPRSYSDAEGEIHLQRTTVQNQNSGWPEHTFSGSARLEAIEEGPEIPPSREESLDVEPHAVDKGGKEIDSPQYRGENLLLTYGENLQNQNGFDSKVVAARFVEQDVQPISRNSQSVWEDGQSVSSAPEQSLVVESHGMDEGGKESDPPWHRGENLLMTFSKNYQNQNGSDSKVVEARFIDQDAQPSSGSQSAWEDGQHISDAPSSSRITLIENEPLRENAPTAVEYVIGPAASIHVNRANLTEVEEEDESTENSDTDNKPVAIVPVESHSEVRVSRFRRRESTVDWTTGNDDYNEEARSSNGFAIISPATPPVYVNHFAEFVKIDDSSEKPDVDETTVGGTTGLDQRQTLWRRASAVDWAGGNAEESEEASSSLTDYDTNITPTTPPVYVNHFAHFVKLAMAGASTAKDILASASSSSTAKTTQLEAPAPALIAPAPALITRPPALITPPSALFARAPGLITQAPAWISVIKNPEEGGASSAWITVIKDGKDARNDDSRWELDRMVKAKEDEFM